ncbi:MAG: WbqC family protein [Methanobacteriota archaeon]
MTAVAIHQPNFAPYPGFFRKMARADVFVLYDTAQYSKNGYHNRCRIKTPRGPAWLTIPVRSPSRRPIGEVEIDPATPWAERLWMTVEANYARAPHFREYAPDLGRILRGRTWGRLVDLNVRFLEFLREALGVTTKVVHASRLPTPSSTDPTGRILELVRAVGGTTYVSGAGGRDYLDVSRFRDVSLEYSEFRPRPYPQLWGAFVPNLSTMDALLNCGPDDTRALLSAHSSARRPD